MEKPASPRHLLMLIMATLLSSACATTEPAPKPAPGDELLNASSYVEMVNRRAREQNVQVYWIYPPR